VISDLPSIGQHWKTWKKCFETYITVLGVTDKAQKHALLLYQAGKAMHVILNTLGTGASGDYDTATKKLDAYFTLGSTWNMKFSSFALPFSNAM